MTILKELSKYELDLVEMQEVRWGRSDTKLASEYIYLHMERGMKIKNCVQVSFLCMRGTYQQLRWLSLLVIGCRTKH
jgi:hypothetical protein